MVGLFFLFALTEVVSVVQILILNRNGFVLLEVSISKWLLFSYDLATSY